MRFTTTVRLSGRNTGIEVPAEVLDALGAGRRPAVRVVVDGYAYTSTVGSMGGVSLIPLSAAHRAASGLAGGETVEVDLEVDDAPRVLEVPADLRAALADDPDAAAFFDGLSYSRRSRIVLAVDGAKGEDTRRRRITKAVADLHEGKA